MDEVIKNTDYDYLALKKAARTLCAKYDFLIPKTIGKSVLGRDIISLQIGREKEYVLLAAAFHGSEHITTNLLLKFTEELCCAFSNGSPLGGYNISRILSGRGVIILPLVNPDGAEISINGPISAGNMKKTVEKLSRGDYPHWNANLRGVDINHNFDADWGSVKKREQAAGIWGPAPSKYGGERPFSEPETLALAKLCEAHNIRHALAFHSQGEVIFADSPVKIPRMDKIAQILSTSSGYCIAEPQGTAVGGGFKDWFIKRFERPAFTVEIGKGENPLPIESIEKIYGELREMLILSVAM
ncbi:MAG: M14 family metallocarboxypeptidase [Clostridiales bacterium]|nr:M14 family metallocarboxypeptidase [Candidatus Equinaster intestinalis]